jgi:hypothetical protein
MPCASGELPGEGRQAGRQAAFCGRRFAAGIGGGFRIKPLLLSKSFKYTGHQGSEGAVFHGGIFADEEGLYLVHNKTSWESGNTAVALFGLLGALIHHLCTRKKQASYPFEGMDFGSLPFELSSKFDAVKVGPEARLSIVRKTEITGIAKSMMKGARIQVGGIEITVLSPKKQAWHQLCEWGYPELA